MKEFEVIIIGAGPIGLSCGVEAVRRNISHLIIEKGFLVNSIFHYPTNMTFFSTSDRLEIGGVPFVSHGDKPTRREALEYYRRLKATWNLNVHTYELVNSVQRCDEGFIVHTVKEEYRCNFVIIATGFYDQANMLGIPGENLPKVFHYFQEAHPFIDQKVAVIGAGNSAVDVALELYRRGAEVTMIIRENKIKDSVKYWVKPDIENRLKENSIHSYFNSVVKEIKEKSIIIKTTDEILELPNDFVFAMTGYHSDFQFLASMGIEQLKGDEPVYNEQTFESNQEGIYLAGVVCSGYDTQKWFIENSRDHAVHIFDSIEKKRGKS
jgi:thioredoxin reductase (NADPH)